LHGFGGTGVVVAQLQQFAQVLVFLQQLFGLLQALGLGDGGVWYCWAASRASSTPVK